MQRIGRVCYIIVSGLLLLLFALLTLGIRPISLTSDEPAHLVAGYSILMQGKKAFWLLPQHGHPPLLNVLSALIFYFGKPDVPITHLEGWATDFTRYNLAFFPYMAPVMRTEFAIRVPTIFWTMVLGALIFRWGKELWGRDKGLLALFLLVFDPLLLAHGRLATTDVGATVLGTVALYLAWRWIKHPSWSLTWPLGLACGLTMLAKASGVLWTLAIVLIAIALALSYPDKKQMLALILQGVWVVLLGFIVVWAGHAFTLGIAWEDFPFAVPAPDYWKMLANQAQSYQVRWVFALGTSKLGGWWWYFPLGFLIKNPLPLLFGLFTGILWAWRRPLNRTRFLALGVFPIIYTEAAIVSGINIGYRHMLPVHPFIYLIGAAGIWYTLFRPPQCRWRLGLALVLGLWYALGTIKMLGYEIAYFNEIVGGASNGHHYLVDSNIDWGQGYKALYDYLQKHPGPALHLAYQYWWVQPQLYGIDAQPLYPAPLGHPLSSPFHPSPGRYAISITVLQSGRMENPDMYIWFRSVRPTANLGFSFFLYDVNSPPPKWLAQCSAEVVPLSDKVIQEGFGDQSLRQIEFDCLSSWIYPSNGTQPGVYSFHRRLMRQRRDFPFLIPSPPEPRDPFVARHLSSARLSVDMKRYTAEHPSFVLYELEGPSGWTPLELAIVRSPEIIPDCMGPFTRTPVPLQGPLTFLGTDVFKTGNQLDIETFWQVTEGPVLRPLSVMGHLVSGKGELVAQSDGMGVSPVFWQPGDVIVQRHRFANLPEGEDLWLRTGVYWLDTMERWAVIDAPEGSVLWIPITGSCAKSLQDTQR
ncbi:MAG: glycosyltransferase family 39 protein [Candidatus Methanosuratincola sp.]